MHVVKLRPGSQRLGTRLFAVVNINQEYVIFGVQSLQQLGYLREILVADYVVGNHDEWGSKLNANTTRFQPMPERKMCDTLQLTKNDIR